MNCCDIDAIVTVDSRGQVVLPKEIRDSFGLEEGGKLALITLKKEGVPCCISLMPVQTISEHLESFLSPVFNSEEAQS